MLDSIPTARFRVEYPRKSVRQGVRDRTARLRLLRRRAEALLVDPVDLALDREVHRGDAEACVGLVERAHGVRLELRRWMTLLGEPARKRHREAGRVRGGDQLLGARLAAGLVLEA